MAIPHAPIFIHGNDEFTPENGVVGGNGTPADPYRIEGWEVPTVEVHNTTADFILRDTAITVFQFTDGIRLIRVSNATVANITYPTASRIGLLLEESSDSFVLSNAFSGSWLAAVHLSRSRGVTLSNNTIQQGAGVLITGLAVEDYATHTITPDNLAGGRPILYHKNGVGVTVEAVEAGHVIVANCRNVNIQGVRMEGHSLLQLAYVEEVSVANNVLTGGRGMRLFQVQGLNLTANQVDGTTEGLWADSSMALTIWNNSFTANQDQGVLVTDSMGVELRTNGLFEQGVGLQIEDSVAVTVSNNTLRNNSFALRAFRSADLRIFGNEFVDNTIHAVDDTSMLWDAGYPTGGNRWDDYAGDDRCAGPNQTVCPSVDGLGDTPYAIDTDSLDRYPLVGASGFFNTPPVAAFSVTPSQPVVDESVEFNGDASSDAEDDDGILEVRWDWEDDGIWDTGWDRIKRVSTTFPAPRNYTVRMEVMDSGGLRNSTVRLVPVDTSSASPSLLLVTHPDGLFRLGIPQPWFLNWEEEFEIGTAHLVARGPTRFGIVTNIVVTSEAGSVQETEGFLLEEAQAAIEEVQMTEDIETLVDPYILETGVSRAVVFIIHYLDAPLTQLLAAVASPSLGRLWVVVGTSHDSVFEEYRPVFLEVVVSFEPLSAPAPLPTGNPYLPIAAGIGAGAAVGVTVWLLRTRRKRARVFAEPSAGPPSASVPPAVASSPAEDEEPSHPRFCAHCGARLVPPYRFCTNCGVAAR